MTAQCLSPRHGKRSPSLGQKWWNSLSNSTHRAEGGNVNRWQHHMNCSAGSHDLVTLEIRLGMAPQCRLRALGSGADNFIVGRFLANQKVPQEG